MDIFEANKPSAAELGSQLWLGRTHAAPGLKYDDLDEIYSRALEPLVDNMREVVKFRHYMDDRLGPTLTLTLTPTSTPNPNPTLPQP